MAGRELGTFLAVATLAATEIGTITFMYYAELGYKTGYASFVNGLIAGLVMIFLGRTGFIVKRLRAMRLMTVPEFFEVKFSRNLRVFVGILVATGGILNMGVFLKVEGTFLAIISGISLSHIKAVMTGILLLELVYTVLGGMVSIVITDFIQFVALSVGTILVTLWSVHATGVTRMYEAVRQTMGAGGFNPFANPEYGWAYIAFQVLIWLAIHTCWQTTAMRTFSTRSPEVSKRVFSWAGFIFLGRGMMPMMWGIAALALLGPSQNSLEAMPRMLATILPSGVLGLGGRGDAGRNDVGQQLVFAGLERDHCAGHHRAAAQEAAHVASAGDAESRRESLRQPVRDGVGSLVHAARTNLFLPEHDGDDLSVGNTGGRGGRIVLGPSFDAGRIPGDGGRGGRDDWFLFLQDSRQLCRSRSVCTGRDRYGRWVRWSADESRASCRRRLSVRRTQSWRLDTSKGQWCWLRCWLCRA